MAIVKKNILLMYSKRNRKHFNQNLKGPLIRNNELINKNKNFETGDHTMRDSLEVSPTISLGRTFL